MFAPMHRRGSLLGVISAQSYTPERYTQVDMTLLQKIADTTQPTVERLLAEQRSKVFLGLGRNLAGATCPEEAARIIVAVADELVGWDSCFVELYHAERGRVEQLLSIDIVNGVRQDVSAPFETLDPSDLQKRILREGAFMIDRNTRHEAGFELLPFGDLSRPSETMIFAPVKSGPTTIGFLSVQSYTENAYDEEDVRIVEALASHCSAALERTRTERQLRKSEERYRTVVETVETVIVGLGLDNTVVEWNRQAELLFGWSREEILGKSYVNLCLPEDERIRVSSAIHRAIHGDPSGSYINRILTRAGEERVINWQSTHLRNDEDQVIGLLCCGQDMTAQKQWELELQRSEAYYRAIVEDQTELICRFCIDGSITFANEAFCEYYGLEREDLPNMNFFGFSTDASRDVLQLQLGQLTPEDPIVTVHQQVVLPNGELRWQEWNQRAIFHDDGLLIGYQAAGRDISRLREAQEALRRSQERYLKLLESSDDVILQLTREGEVVYANHACQKVFGKSPSDFLEEGSALQRLVHPDAHERYARFWANYQVSESFPQESEPFPWLLEDGRIVYTENRFNNLYDPDGRVESVLAICRDVTGRVKLEQERRELEAQITQTQKLESMSVLAGGIAHDFNNLLTGILGNAGLVIGELEGDSAAMEHALHIQTAALRASELTKQMLAYAGKGTFVVQPLNLSAVVREMTGLLKTVISRNARLSLDLALELPFVQADATQLRQVVMNLITNASDALEGREGTIRLTTGVMRLGREVLAPMLFGNLLEPDEYVVLEVEDTGCGIDAETRKRMFDPFFTRKPTGLVGGRGLGLAAVLGIVRNHRGAIHVRSTIGEGTTFQIVLPKSSFNESQSPLPVPRKIARQFDRDGLVLVVDDEEIVRRVAKGALTKAGYEVLQAADGLEALEQVEQRGDQITAVLLDLRMPRMDGRTCYGRIRALHPDMPIILMSGYTEEEVSEALGKTTPTIFVEKPFSPTDLLEAIDRVTARRAAG
jgi:PAS domain S-box-containing protein